MEERGVTHCDQETFRAQEASGDLHPRFRTGLVDELIALCCEFVGCGGYISDLELDAGLRDWNVNRSLCGAETSACGLRKRPQFKVLCSFQLVSEDIVPLFALKAYS